MYKFFFSFCVILLLVSCKHRNKVEVDNSGAVVINLNKEETENSIDSIVTNMQCIRLEASSSSKLSGIQGVSKMLVVNNILYILDKQFSSIKAFSLLGKYLFEVGGLGVGEDKFLRAEDFVYNPTHKTLWVLCNAPKKIAEYSLDGKFMKNINIDFFASSMGMVSPGTFCYYVNQNETSVSEKKNLLITDTNNNVTGRFFDFPQSVNTMLQFTGGIYQTNNKVFFNPPFDHFVYQISEGKIKSSYKMNFGNEDLSIPAIKRSFLGTSFVELGNYVNFNYQKNGVYQTVIFNKKIKKVFTNNIKYAPVNFLFSSNVISQHNDTLMFLIEPKYIQGILKKNEIAIKKRFPGVYDKLIENDSINKALPNLTVLKINLKDF